jgi:putative iron-regulated protein
MKKLVHNAITGCFIAATLISCNNDDETVVVQQDQINTVDVIANYAAIVVANYQAALNDATTLETAVANFISNPTQITFDAAKNSWLNARESYGTTEAFRFANGPIDSGATEEIEGLLNSWPMDESFVDYVSGAENSGIINNISEFTSITKDVLSNQNGAGGEENVAVGYHAIEFLLWGQDLTDPTESMPGLRPFTDFVDNGTAQNQDRRRQYLAVCADLLTDHLEVLITAWNGSYKTTFLGLEDTKVLDNMLSSIAELSRSELAIERMAVALQNQDQEDEHSCFSDNTHRDIRLNLAGVANVYNGTFGTINGTSLADLIAQENAPLASELTSLLNTAILAVNNTAIPFDLAIVGGISSTEGAKVQTAVQALVAFGDKLLEAKAPLGIN